MKLQWRLHEAKRRGTPLFAKMPFELERVGQFPAPEDTMVPTLPTGPTPRSRRAAATIPDDDTFSHRTATPILVGGVLFVGSPDGRMLALDPASGVIKWRVEVGAEICAAAAAAGD